MKKYFLAHFCLFLANLIYGVNYTLAKDIMPNYMQPFSLVFLRITGAFFLFFIIYKTFIKEVVQKKDILIFAVCGLFGVAINQMLFLYGLNF